MSCSCNFPYGEDAAGVAKREDVFLLPPRWALQALSRTEVSIGRTG